LHRAARALIDEARVKRERTKSRECLLPVAYAENFRGEGQSFVTIVWRHKNQL